MTRTAWASGKIRDLEGVVWEVDTEDGRPLMLISRPKDSNSLRELEMLGRLHHPNIISLARVSELSGLTITMRIPLFDLGTAQRLLNSVYQQGMPETAVVHTLRDVLSALSYLHREAVIHRAVNAANVWLNGDGGVVLAGFHHAIHAPECNKWIGVEDRVYEFDESLEDVLVWLAPEVLKQDLNGYDTKSDIYSVGILCCELGNGFAPFVEMEPMQMLFEKANNSTPFLIDSSTDGGGVDENPELTQKTPFSPALHSIVTRCLTYCPEERPCADEVLKEFDALCPSVRQTLAQLLPAAKPLELVGTNTNR